MGMIIHSVIIVTGTQPDIEIAHGEASSIFPIVSPLVSSEANSFYSFFVAPDGGKEGRDTAEEGKVRRDKFVLYLRDHEFDMSLDWVEARYGDLDIPYISRHGGE